MQKTALLFAGQGAQTVGMGRDLASHFPTARALFDEADQLLGYDIAGLCFDGPEAELTRTEHAQPAIFLVSWIAFELLRAHVPQLTFQAAAGLSLGEFTALAAAGVMPFQSGLRLVRQRGQFMQEACEKTHGTMAAIMGLDEQPTHDVCVAAGVELANLNCPGQIVISGETERIHKACELASARGAKKTMLLTVAGAYHSRLMQPAQSNLATALQTVSLQPPTVSVLSNVTARPHQSPAEIGDLLLHQVTAPVRWEASMRYLLEQGFNRFIELGPGRTLQGFLKRIHRDAEIFSVSDKASLETAAAQLLLEEPGG